MLFIYLLIFFLLIWWSLNHRPLRLIEGRWTAIREVKSQWVSQDEIARIRKRKRGRNMLNRSGNTTDNLCFRYRFRDVFSRFRCCVYNGTGPLLRKHNGNTELHVSDTFQKYGNMWFRPVCVWGAACGAVGGGGRVVRILQSLIGVIRSSLSWKNQNPPTPIPLPQVMNNDRPPFSYLFIVFFFNSFITFIYLFIFYYFFY